MMEIVNTVEAKIKELNELVQSHMSAINNITASVEQMLGNKANLQAEIQKVQGAIQAFSQTSQLIQSKITPANVETALSDIGAVASAIDPSAAPAIAAVEGIASAVGTSVGTSK